MPTQAEQTVNQRRDTWGGALNERCGRKGECSRKGLAAHATRRRRHAQHVGPNGAAERLRRRPRTPAGRPSKTRASFSPPVGPVRLSPPAVRDPRGAPGSYSPAADKPDQGGPVRGWVTSSSPSLSSRAATLAAPAPRFALAAWSPGRGPGPGPEYLTADRRASPIPPTPRRRGDRTTPRHRWAKSQKTLGVPGQCHSPSPRRGPGGSAPAPCGPRRGNGERAHVRTPLAELPLFFPASLWRFRCSGGGEGGGGGQDAAWCCWVGCAAAEPC